MIDFPASPTVGQIFTSGGQQWMWDGTKWLPNGQINAAVVPMGDNRIINGDMRIDQRNNGASGTATGVYTIDRWIYNASAASRGTWQRSTSVAMAANGFPYCLTFTSNSTAASVATDNFAFIQPIEADMVSDFAWGTAGAQPVTLSFWINVSSAGLYSGAIANGAAPPTRSYPFSFNAVAGWQKVVIPIPGDTGGTWTLSGNAIGAQVKFDLGSGANLRGPANAWASAGYVGVTGSVSVVGTNAAAFQVTGVKLEIGAVATPFNRQSLAKSLADCQRYYQNLPGLQVAMTSLGGTTYTCPGITLPVVMRATPTAVQSGNSYGSCTGVNTSPSSPISISTYLSGCSPNVSCWASFTLALSAEL